MRIKEVTEEKIVFDNGTEITYYHCDICCEQVYADFKVLLTPSPIDAMQHDFEDDIHVEIVPRGGIRIGDGKWYPDGEAIKKGMND